MAAGGRCDGGEEVWRRVGGVVVGGRRGGEWELCPLLTGASSAGGMPTAAHTAPPPAAHSTTHTTTTGAPCPACGGRNFPCLRA